MTAIPSREATPAPPPHHQKGTLMDTTMCTIAINAMLDVIWPLLPVHTLDELAYV